jgi:hypothetical protein
MDDGDGETTDEGGDGDSSSSGDGDSGSDDDTGGDGDGDSQVDVNGSCLADADCGPAYHCVLGLCKEGCLTADQCTDGQECTPHGECRDPEAAEEDPFEEEGTASILQDQTEWDQDTTELVFTLRNQSTEEMDYRLSPLHLSLLPDAELGVVPPMSEVQISVPIDTTLIDQAVDRYLIMEVITEVQSLDARLVVPPSPTGNYSGTLSFNQASLLGQYRVSIDLTFDPATGEVEGWLFPDDTVMFPNQVKANGTYDPATGDFYLRILDIMPSQYPGANGLPPQLSPLGREVGRDIVLNGQLLGNGTYIEGTMTETLSGLTTTAIIMEGSFRLNHQTGDLRDPSGADSAADFTGLVPISLPDSEWPAELETIEIGNIAEDVCAGLTSDYGTSSTLIDGPNAADAGALILDSEAQRVLACAACGTEGTLCDPSLAADENEAAERARNAVVCAGGLVQSGYNVPAIIDNSKSTANPIDPNGKWSWTECTNQSSGPYDSTGAEGTTCIDPRALACAGRLYRQAMSEDTSENQSAGWTDAALQAHLTQISKEAAGSNLIAIEEQIQAAFAYESVSAGQVAAEELRRIRDESRRLLDRSAQITSAPGFTHTLGALGYDIVVNENQGADVNLAMTSAAKAADAMALQMRLMVAAELDDSNRPNMRDLLNHAAAWNHAQSALWFATLDYWGVSDNWDELSFFGETAAELYVAHEMLKDGRNQFGYDPNWVPIKLTAAAAEDTTNFEIVWDDAMFLVDAFFDRLQEASAALDAYDTQSFNVTLELNKISNMYDERLGDLCGYDDEGNPALGTCGQSASDISRFLLEIQQAQLVVQQARQQLSNNHELIKIEEDTIREIIANEQALQQFIADSQGEIFQIGEDAFNQVGAQQAMLAERQCTAQYEQAGVETAIIAAEAIFEAADNLGESPIPNVSGATAAAALGVAKGIAEFGKAALECDLINDTFDIESEIGTIEFLAEGEIDVINTQIEDAMRDAGLEEKVILSKQKVAQLALEGMTLGIQVKEAVKAQEIAVQNLGQAVQEVAALVKRRDRRMALIDEANPLNPMANPRFLQARLELGKDVLARRIRALREAYTAGRALEYHTNGDIPQIETMLVSARSETEIEDFMVCAMAIFNDYKLQPASSSYDKEISLREDIFGLLEPVYDSATGYTYQPEELFHEVLADPEHILPDGSLQFAVGLPLQGDSLFSSAICDDKLDTVEIMVEGEQLGDEDMLVQIERRGGANLRKCEEGLSSTASLVTYNLGDANAAIQAGVNDWSTGQPNGSFTDWPTSGEQWIITIPRDPGVAPQNQDVNFSTISDIKLRLIRRGRPLSAPFNPTCN